MKRSFYRYLLRLHPAAFRDRFADEMLWIFDETVEQPGLRVFADGCISLLRQWTLHSGVWKMASGAVVSCLLLTGWWHFQKAALASALRRSNPEVLKEIKHLHPTGLPCLVPTGEIVRARAIETVKEPQPDGAPFCDVADAVQGIVAAFQRHPVVMIGEVHWIERAGYFYVRLVRDPKFQETVEDIVIEFASRNNQPLLDRYIAGEDLPNEEVRRIWRDTTKVASWESPIYSEWLAAIREVNQGLPSTRRLRVLASDTAIDWKNIHTPSDWLALGDNNISFADVILNEVLRKKHRALVVLGMNHVLKSGDRNGDPDTTTRVESRYPGSTYVVLLDNRGLLHPAVEEFVRFDRLRENVSVLCELAGTRLGEAADGDAAPLARKADALLYLGPPEALTLSFPPAGSLEPAYLKEVDRRSMIEWGELRARKFLGAAAQ
ncbi:MAG TPA: hypothetical protein VNB49_07100 [Candidatus Dormibacteraeota bacterium]|nr:hypothetical protein [Candidatus Dormibacteraeota bacterium]